MGFVLCVGIHGKHLLSTHCWFELQFQHSHIVQQVSDIMEVTGGSPTPNLLMMKFLRLELD